MRILTEVLLGGDVWPGGGARAATAGAVRVGERHVGHAVLVHVARGGEHVGATRRVAVEGHDVRVVGRDHEQIVGGEQVGGALHSGRQLDGLVEREVRVVVVVRVVDAPAFHEQEEATRVTAERPDGGLGELGQGRLGGGVALQVVAQMCALEQSEQVLGRRGRHVQQLLPVPHVLVADVARLLVEPPLCDQVATVGASASSAFLIANSFG